MKDQREDKIIELKGVTRTFDGNLIAVDNINLYVIDGIKICKEI